MDELETEDSGFTDAADILSSKPATLEIVSVNKSEIFSQEECERIINNCIDELWLPSKVVGTIDLHKSSRQKLRGDIEGFPFLNIRDITKNANSSVYDFNLLGIIDQDYPQVFKYSKDDFYKTHIELNPAAPSRKISFIICLNDPDTYEGGQIEFLNMDTAQHNLNEQGGWLVFHSFIQFSISPVVKGECHFIVGHVHGALFR